MIQKGFTYRVKVIIALSKDEIDTIVGVGRNHYDAKCREMAEIVRNWPLVCDQQNGDYMVDLSASDLDRIAKVLEQEPRDMSTGLRVLYVQWTAIFKAYREEVARIINHGVA